jgi:nucleotide-binding universal stress UspA family protein
MMIQSTPASPMKILLAVENSPYLSGVLRMVTQINWPPDSSVFLLVAVPEQLPLFDTHVQTRRYADEATEIRRWRGWAATKLLVDRVRAELRGHHLRIEHTEICAGPLSELIFNHPSDFVPDTIVLEARLVDQPQKIWPDSTTKRLAAEYLPHSILVVRPSKPVFPLHTILAVDDSPEAWQALDFVKTLALPNWAKVTLLYLSGEQNAFTAVELDLATSSRKTKPLPPLPDVAEPFVVEAVSYMHDCGIAVRWLQRRGHPVDELLTVAREQAADLIVVGTEGSPWVKSWPYPTISQNILINAPCSVLALR